MLLGVAAGRLWPRCDEFYAAQLALRSAGAGGAPLGSAAEALLAAHGDGGAAAPAPAPARALGAPLPAQLRSLCAAGAAGSWRPLLLLLLPALRYVLARALAGACRALALVPPGAALLSRGAGDGSWLRAGVAALRGMARGNALVAALTGAAQAALDAAAFARDVALDAALFTVALVLTAAVESGAV